MIQIWLYLYSLPILWSNYPCFWRSCCHCWELLYAGFQSVEPLATVCNDFKSMLLACCCFFSSNQYAWNNLCWCCGVSSYAVLACIQLVDVRMRQLTFLLVGWNFNKFQLLFVAFWSTISGHLSYLILCINLWNGRLHIGLFCNLKWVLKLHSRQLRNTNTENNKHGSTKTAE